MLIKDAIKFGQDNKLNNIDVRELLKFILKVDESYLIIHNNEYELSQNEEKSFKDYCQKIKAGYPLQYITHKQNFYGNEFYVDENVLIPQPDTEILVHEAIEEIKKKDNQSNIKVIDLCTGSGAIAISIKKEVPQVKMYASDISDEAIEVAKRNTKIILENKKDDDTNLLTVRTQKDSKEKILFIKSNMFEEIPEGLKFDIIVSNPPYIKEKDMETLPKDVLHEPKIALLGGEDGLDFYRIIRREAPKYLNENGVVLLEIGYDEKEELLKFFEGAKCIKDFAGNDRVIYWKKQ
jgi:release factor glutamine methyltransferase